MYSPLTTMPRSTVPWRIQLLSTMTPDSIPAQALDRSNVIALVAPIASATAALMVGSSHCVRPSRYFVMLQLITTSSDDAGWSDRLRQSCAAAMARVYESSSPIDTRRSWIPVSRSRSMCVRWRVDAIRSSVVRWVLGRRRPTLASRARYGDRTASDEVSSMSQCLTIAPHFPYSNRAGDATVAPESKDSRLGRTFGSVGDVGIDAKVRPWTPSTPRCGYRPPCGRRSAP